MKMKFKAKLFFIIISCFLITGLTLYFIQDSNIQSDASFKTRTPSQYEPYYWDEFENLCHKPGYRCRNSYECCSFQCKGGVCLAKRKKSPKFEIGRRAGHYKKCKSLVMDHRGFCAATTSYRSNTFQYCDHYKDCISGLCDREYLICRGTSNQKATYGQFCRNNRECLSGRCDQKKLLCLGSSYDPALSGENCSAGNQCESKKCDFEEGTCF